MATIAEALNIGVNYHNAGNLQAAEQVYRQILQVDPSQPDALHLLGVIASQSGKHDLAVQYINAAIARQPRNPIYLGNLGIAYQELGKSLEAVATYQKALQLQPNYPEAYHNLSTALLDLGRVDEALANVQQALRLRPNYPDALNNLGNVFKTMNRLPEAEAAFRQALSVQPNHTDVLNNLGNTLKAQGRVEEAIACYQQSLRLRPNFAAAFGNLGTALYDEGKLDEALAHYREAVRLQPNDASAHNNVGKTLASQGKMQEAADSYRTAIRLKPDFTPAYNNLGNALAGLNRPDEAAATFQQALRLKPDYAKAHNNLGALLASQGQMDEAQACYRAALRYQPDFAEAANNLGTALVYQGKLDEAVASFRDALRHQANFPGAHSNLLLTLNYQPDVDDESLFAEHCRWEPVHGPGPGALRPHTNERNPDRKLRVGYVSPDLREHAVARFLEPILAHHDPAAIEAICYAEVRVADSMTARLQSLAKGWRSTVGLSDAMIAEQVRRDGIDILVDLAGHSASNRLQTFTYKPAPVQVTYLGYCYSTGLKTIDYRLTDDIADPPGEEARYSEKLVHLPGGFCCFSPPNDVAEVGPLPADRNGRITFGSLHHLAKLNPQVIEQWSAILRAIPGSRLLIFRHCLTGSAQDRLRNLFKERGIEADRLDMRHAAVVGRMHWNLYGEIDLSLDPFPWTGHTTACEAMWMGVPVVTLRGSRHAGRMVTSVLTSLGMIDWVAATPEEYVDLSIRAAGDWDRLRAVRSGLREKMRSSPLCDGAAFTRKLEAAYRDMWHKWASAESRTIR